MLLRTRSLYCAFLLLCFFRSASAQMEVLVDTTITRLKKELLAHKNEDTVRVKLLNDLAYALLSSQPDASEEKIKRSLLLAKKIHFTYGEADAYNILGILNVEQANFDKAIDYYLKSLKLYTSLKTTTGDRKAAIIERNIGMFYTSQEKPKEALKYLEKAYTKFEKLQDSIWLIRINNSLFACQMAFKDTLKASKYLEKALNIATALKNEYWYISTSLNTILCKDPHHKSGEIVATYKNAARFFEKIGAKRDVAQSIFNLGYHYATFTQEKDSAIFYLEKSIKQYEELQQKNAVSKSHKVLYFLYADAQDFKNAFLHLKVVDSLDRLILNETTQKNIADLEIKYQTEKKEQENAILRRDNAIKQKNGELKSQLIYAISIVSLFIILSGILLFLRFRERKKVKEAEIKQQLENYSKEIYALRAVINARINENPSNEQLMFHIEKINLLLSSPLTEREFDVLKELNNGKTNKEIAESLFLSVNTVKTHLLNIFTKLDVSNRIQAKNKVIDILQNTTQHS